MTRNTANVVGIGIAISIVTATMASKGFEPSLDAVAAGGVGVEAAFTQGLRIAFTVLLGAFIGISIVLTFLKRVKGEEHFVGSPAPTHGTRVSGD